MALVAPTRATVNPLPAGKYFIVLEPDRVEDFTDWAAIYFPHRLVTLLNATPQGGQVHSAFEVHEPGKVFWWPNVFAGMPFDVSNAPRVVAPSVDRVQRALEVPIHAAETAVKAIDWQQLATIALLGGLLYLYLSTKGVSHVSSRI